VRARRLAGRRLPLAPPRNHLNNDTYPLQDIVIHTHDRSLGTATYPSYPRPVMPNLYQNSTAVTQNRNLDYEIESDNYDVQPDNILNGIPTENGTAAGSN
jgi:hypothetical protein